MAAVSFAVAMSQWKALTGWSDQDIATATGLHKTTVARIRLGKHIPQPATDRLLRSKLYGLSKFLGPPPRDTAPRVDRTLFNG